MTTIQHRNKLTKLKDSCEACGRSKVKCSRDKPVCKRCAERQWPCVYGPSCRTGRHPSRYFKAPTPTKTLPSRDEQHILYSVHEFKPSRHASAAHYDPFTPHLLFSQVQTRDNTVETRHCPSSLAYGSQESSSDMIWSNAPNPRETNFNEVIHASRQIQNEQTTSPANSCPLVPSNSDSIAAVSIQSLSKLPGFDSAGQFGQNHHLARTRQTLRALSLHKSGDCLVNALHILQRLFAASSSFRSNISSCLGDRNPEHSMNQIIYSALTETQHILHATVCILACKCSRDASLALLLSMAAFQILEWYTSALTLLYSNSGMASGSTNARSRSDHYDASQRWGDQFRRESPMVESSTNTRIESSPLSNTSILGEAHAIRRVVRLLRVRLQELQLQGLDRATGAAKATMIEESTSKGSSRGHVWMEGMESADSSSSPSISAPTTQQLIAELDHRYRMFTRTVLEGLWRR